MKNEIFKANPQLDCYFETADGECFFTENAAKNHAGSLAEKTVKTHHKSDYVEPTDEVDQVVEPTEPVQDTSDSELAKQIEVTADIVEPTETVEPVASVEPKATEGKAKNQKK